MMTKMTPGTRVLLTDGMFGTLRAMGDRQAVIELAPGLDVTVLRQAIARALKPDEEEFEYEEAGEAVPLPPASGQWTSDSEPAEDTESADHLDGAHSAVPEDQAWRNPTAPATSPEQAGETGPDSAEFWTDMERRMQSRSDGTADDHDDQR
jgi:preprotein translocase subunit YajC